MPTESHEATQLPAAAREIATSLDVMERSAAMLVIETADDYSYVADQVKRANEYAKALEEQRMNLTRPLDALKQQWMALFEPRTSAAKRVVQVLKSKLVAFDQEQERKRREAEAAARAERERIEREAEAARRAERERIEAQQRAEREAAERDQREAAQRAREAQDRAARERAEADQAAAAQRAREADEAAARQREELRQREEVERFMAPAVMAQHVEAAPKVSGVSKRVTWKVASVDLAALVVAAGKAIEAGDRSLLPLLTTVGPELNRRVRALGEHTNIPGVFVEREQSVAVGR